MKTNINETSIEAYQSLSVAGYLQPKEAQVMSVFTDESIALTRRQLAAKTGMELSSVCGRVNSLIAKNALTVRGRVKDAQTHKTVEVFGLPVPMQSELVGMVA